MVQSVLEGGVTGSHALSPPGIVFIPGIATLQTTEQRSYDARNIRRKTAIKEDRSSLHRSEGMWQPQGTTLVLDWAGGDQAQPKLTLYSVAHILKQTRWV